MCAEKKNLPTELPKVIARRLTIVLHVFVEGLGDAAIAPHVGMFPAHVFYPISGPQGQGNKRRGL